MELETRISLLDGIKNDNEVYWRRFYGMYAPLIRLHGRDCGIKTAHIDDLIQDVMITISRQIKNFTYQRDLGKFRNFLRKIIRARAMDMLRKIYRQELHLPELGLQEEAVLDDQYDQEWRDHVRKVSLLLLKQSVSPRHYQIFDFLDIQNRKVREIATLYNLPESTIYSIRNRTEEKLRLIIKEHKLY